MNTLVIAEHDNQQLKPATLNTITAARQLTDTCEVLVVGASAISVAEQAATTAGVSKVLHVDAAELQHASAEQITQCVMPIASDYSHILAPASTFGKNVMPRLAAKCDVAQISDITEIIDAETFVRPIYAGNAISKVRALDKLKIITVRPTAFTAAAKQDSAADITSLTFDSAELVPAAKVIAEHYTKSERPELGSARVVVSGGRGLQSGDNFKMIEQLADKLNAAIGATRAAVDAGFVPNDYQVGQTGKVVAPELYIAIGISGAIQHLAGMKDSKVIVAINKDPEAPIFQVADYGLVGDLFTIVPDLIEVLA